MAKKTKPSDAPIPPLWTGVAGQGNQKIYSLGGRWHPVGSKTQGGYQVVGDDGKENLILSWNGLPITVPMGKSSPTPYNPSQPTDGFNMAPKWMGGGAMSSTEEEHMLNNPYMDPTPPLSISGMDKDIVSKTYNVIDRTGIDEFIGRMRAENPDVNFGTLEDFQNATPEQRKKGFKVWNNASEDFTDFFQDQ
jgi:hypothetical protein